MAALDTYKRLAGLSNSCVSRALDLYRETYHADPEVLAFAPGRVNLIGDHTDYAEGLVLPAALIDGCVCAIGANASTVTAASSELTGTPSIGAESEIQPEHLSSLPGWFRYAAGTFESMRQRFAPTQGGVNIAVASDVPSGSGLSSSAALEVSIATALEALWGLDIDDVDKALACQAAEHRFAEAPCGLMDQFVSITGKLGHAVRIDFRNVSSQHVPLPSPDAAVFVLLDSAVEHANDDGGYAARRAACESVLPKLGVRSLREVSLADLDGLPDGLTPEERDAVHHVVTENDRVARFSAALTEGRFADAGQLMAASHDSLSDVYRVSCPQVDTLVEIANRHEAVFGARMTGGGFGGWTVALIRAGAEEEAATSILAEYQSATGLESSWRLVEAGDGAEVLPAPASMSEVVSARVNGSSTRV
ncbi:MAG: galactokinase [Planctomycetota bacterium]